MKYLMFFEEISAEKVLSKERRHDDNMAASKVAAGADGEVNQYGFDCVFVTYGGVKLGNFEAKSVGGAKSVGDRSSIVDVKSGDRIASHSYDPADVVKVIDGPDGVKALFMKNMLCFVIPGMEGGDRELFRGWIKTNDRKKVVGFLKKWGLFNKVNINDVMLVADKLKNLQSLKQDTGSIKGSKKVTIDDVKNILNGDSETKAEDIMKLFGK